MTIHICSFSRDVARLTKKQKKDPMAVLQAILQNGWVSTWDMGEDGLYKTIAQMIKAEYILEVSVDYPWHRFEVTLYGGKVLAEYQK